MLLLKDRPQLAQAVFRYMGEHRLTQSCLALLMGFMGGIQAALEKGTLPDLA